MLIPNQLFASSYIDVPNSIFPFVAFDVEERVSVPDAVVAPVTNGENREVPKYAVRGRVAPEAPISRVLSVFARKWPEDDIFHLDVLFVPNVNARFHTTVISPAPAEVIPTFIPALPVVPVVLLVNQDNEAATAGLCMCKTSSHPVDKFIAIPAFDFHKPEDPLIDEPLK